jgi:hypothetical protein
MLIFLSIDSGIYFKKSDYLIIIVVIIFALQFLKRDLNHVQEITVHVFIHVSINTKMGIFPIQFLKSTE